MNKRPKETPETYSSIIARFVGPNGRRITFYAEEGEVDRKVWNNVSLPQAKKEAENLVRNQIKADCYAHFYDGEISRSNKLGEGKFIKA